MRVRTYGLVMLGVVGIAPLVALGYMTTVRSKATTTKQVIEGNERAAALFAERIIEYMDGERRLIRAIGVGVLHADDPEQAVLAFDLANEDIYEIEVYELRAGSLAALAGEVFGSDAAEYAEFAARAIRNGEGECSEVIRQPRGPAVSVIVSEPVRLVGSVAGVIVARYSLHRLWAALDPAVSGDSEQFEQRRDAIGYARVVDESGALLAHTKRDQARRMYSQQAQAEHKAILERVEAGEPFELFTGETLVASVADIEGYGWRVLVEQPLQAAFEDTNAMIRDLVLMSIAAMIVVILAALAFGSGLVRDLERLRTHTTVLARGELEAAAPGESRFDEARALAESLDEMSASLIKLQEAAQARQRLATFARVAAGLAHDLRTPIETVRSVCEGVAANPADAEAVDLLRVVRDRDLPRLQRYVDDLRRLARGGDLALEREKVAPRALIDEVVEEMSEAPKWRGVRFSARGEAALARLDRNLIRRALVNLAGNGAEACLQASPEGEVIIEVADEGDKLVLQVIDDGVGIPSERVPSLLTADFRSTKRSTGVGLGLGVVKQVVGAHGGTIDVSSQIGEGSVFQIAIPRTPRTPAT